MRERPLCITYAAIRQANVDERLHAPSIEKSPIHLLS